MGNCMDKPTKILTVEEYDKHKSNDRFLHEITFAHGVQGWEPYNKGHCYYFLGSDFKVSPELQEQAKRDYEKRKQEIVNSMGNKLAFVGMGMDFEPTTPHHIGNHRIRTYIKNNDGVLCFVEFGAGMNKDFLRCDHALVNTRKNYSDWSSLGERDRTEKRIELEGIKGDYHPYTKAEVLELVNKHFNCNFTELEVYSYCIGCDDYTSVSKGEDKEVAKNV